MSGRSAHARKKITSQAKPEKSRSSGSGFAPSQYGDPGFAPDFPLPAEPVGTGVGTTSGRFLRFSPPMSPNVGPHPGTSRISSVPSVQSGSSGESQGRGRDYGTEEVGQALEDLSISRRPIMRTEDVSGIEKSGLRSMLDRRSDVVRKGLAKKLTFRKKAKDPGGKQPEVASPEAFDGPFPFARERNDPPLDSYTLSTTSQSPLLGPYSPQHPMFQAFNQSPHQQTFWDAVSPGPPPTSRLPPIPPSAVLPPIKRWIGAGKPVERWIPPTRDPELWDPKGDVLVYLGHKGQTPPSPSFRLSSLVIETTGSRYLTAMLRESLIREDDSVPASPTDDGDDHQHDHDDSSLGEEHYPTSSGIKDDRVKYEMYLPTHSSLPRIDQLRHQISTRNFFAVLYRASFIGFSLHQALTDLQHRLDSYMPPDSDNVQLIVYQLVVRGIDDVRSDPETAVSLLAWSESPDVRWDQGWRDFFAHCVSMYRELERCADFKHTTPVTRVLLERAYLEMQLRVRAAEDRLAQFSFADMWPMEDAVMNGKAKAAADRLQVMLMEHYAQVYQLWPPSAHFNLSRPGSPVGLEDDDEDGPWLTRTVAVDLQKDFGALYDYLVDRGVVWDVSEARAGRKWMIVSGSNQDFEADKPGLPLTDMLIEFDNKFRYPHIPHPYPLVPKSFSLGRGDDLRHPKDPENTTRSRRGPIERRLQVAYTESTNLYILSSDFQNDLVDAFVQFEKTDRIDEADPVVARLGRWVLIYGILQTLASVAVDAPGARYREKVPYHLGVHLGGSRMPPWRHGVMDEAAHELSHCWTTPHTWDNAWHDGEAGSAMLKPGPTQPDETVNEDEVNLGGGHVTESSPSWPQVPDDETAPYLTLDGVPRSHGGNVMIPDIADTTDRSKLVIRDFDEEAHG